MVCSEKSKPFSEDGEAASSAGLIWLVEQMRMFEVVFCLFLATVYSHATAVLGIPCCGHSSVAFKNDFADNVFQRFQYVLSQNDGRAQPSFGIFKPE